MNQTSPIFNTLKVKKNPPGITSISPRCLARIFLHFNSSIDRNIVACVELIYVNRVRGDSAGNLGDHQLRISLYFDAIKPNHKTSLADKNYERLVFLKFLVVQALIDSQRKAPSIILKRIDATVKF